MIDCGNHNFVPPPSHTTTELTPLFRAFELLKNQHFRVNAEEVDKKEKEEEEENGCDEENASSEQDEQDKGT